MIEMGTFVNYSKVNSTNRTFSNECIEYLTVVPGDPVDLFYVQMIFAVMYSLVWLLGVLGNGLVIYVAVVARVSFTVRTVFIVSLAGSDLAIAFTSLPITAVGLFTHQWIFPHFTCPSIGFFQGSSIFLSSFTLTAIAVDRYCLILYPHKSVISYSIARNGLFGLFLIGIVLALPMAIYNNIGEIQFWDEHYVCGVFCMENWPPTMQWVKLTYGLAVPALQFGLPLIINTYCYCEIGKQMKIRHRKRQKQEHLLPKSEQKQNDRRRRVNRMMTTMVISFVAAWLPMNLMNFIRDFELYSAVVPRKHFNLMFAIAHFLAMTSLIWNPFIYSFFHDSFRATIRNLFRRQPLITRSNSSASQKHLTTNNSKSNQTQTTRNCSNSTCLLEGNISQTNRQCSSSMLEVDKNILAPPPRLL